MTTYHHNGDMMWIQSDAGKQAGFHIETGAFAWRRAGQASDIFEEPPLIIGVRPNVRVGGTWYKFNAFYEATEDDYLSAGGNNFWEFETNNVKNFGWEREFDIVNPPAGNDVKMRMAFGETINPRVWMTPYYAVQNWGLEFYILAFWQFIDALTYVQVTRTDDSVVRLPRRQVRNISGEYSDLVAKIGFINHEKTTPFWEFDLTNFGWDTLEIETFQWQIPFGTDPRQYWVLKIGGANLGTPQPLTANVEHRLL